MMTASQGAAVHSFRRMWDQLRSGALVILVGVVLLSAVRLFASEPVLVPGVTYNNGIFTQTTAPNFGPPIQGDWSASIYAMSGDYICGGGGNGTYEVGRVKHFNANDWTGGDCAKLVVGETYEAVASWSYYDSDGLKQTVSLKFEFIRNQTLEGE